MNPITPTLLAVIFAVNARAAQLDTASVANGLNALGPTYVRSLQLPALTTLAEIHLNHPDALVPLAEALEEADRLQLAAQMAAASPDKGAVAAILIQGARLAHDRTVTETMAFSRVFRSGAIPEDQLGAYAERAARLAANPHTGRDDRFELSRMRSILTARMLAKGLLDGAREPQDTPSPSHARLLQADRLGRRVDAADLADAASFHSWRLQLAGNEPVKRAKAVEGLRGQDSRLIGMAAMERQRKLWIEPSWKRFDSYAKSAAMISMMALMGAALSFSEKSITGLAVGISCLALALGIAQRYRTKADALDVARDALEELRGED